MSVVIAIDGPSGVGKSTVAKEVARRLGLAYLDTGATYRATALWCMREGIALTNEQDVVAAAETMNVEMVMDPDQPRILMDGDDVSRELRSESVTAIVSDVATNLSARAVLGQWQRDLIANERVGGFSGGAGVVAEGRDITTVIAPDADVRVLLTADPETRVARRAGEGVHVSIAQIRSGVLGRDARDATAVNFTEAADGVITIDTTDLTIDEVAISIVELAHQALL